MSKLIKETPWYIELQAYVHGGADSYSDWEIFIDPATGEIAQLYSEGVHLAEHYALMEIKVVYRIWKDSTPENPHVEYVSWE